MALPLNRGCGMPLGGAIERSRSFRVCHRTGAWHSTLRCLREPEAPSACVQVRIPAMCERSGGGFAVADDGAELAVEAMHRFPAGAAHGSRIGQQLGPFLSTSGETLTIEESMTLRARTENAGHAGDEHERSWSSSSG